MTTVAIVTGGAQGLGRAIGKRLAADGARVAIWDTQERNGEDTAQACRSSGGDGAFWRVDVGDPVQVAAAAAEVERRWGTPDALINNAGIFPRSDPLDMDLAEWDRRLRHRGRSRLSRGPAPGVCQRAIATTTSITGCAMSLRV